MDISTTLFSIVSGLVAAIGKKSITDKAQKGFEWIKLQHRLDNSLIAVTESLTDFLRDEKITQYQQELLVCECENQLRPLVDNPAPFFAASLDGSKLFAQLYPENCLPLSIQEEKLEHPYRLLFERVATLICTYGPALKQWECESKQEVLRRLDQIAENFIKMSRKIDTVLDAPKQYGDELLARLRRMRRQSIELQIELTSLAGDRPEKGRLEDMFVVPSISKENSYTSITLGTRDELQKAFGKFGQHLLVTGSPGSGKSTFAAWLQRLLLESFDAPFPILVQLRALAQRQILPSDLELIHENIDRMDVAYVSAELVHDWKKQGRLTFILDGFDEIPPPRRDDILKWIFSLSDRFDLGNLIITSRPLTTAHLNDLPLRWMRCEIKPFDTVRVAEYITRWYANAPLLAETDRKVDATAIAGRWSADPVLCHLTGNPLMLSTLLMVHYMEGHELPKGRSELYKRYIDGMLGLWDDRRKIPLGSIDLKREEKRKILTRIAIHFHLSDIDELADEEMLKVVDAILEDADVHCTQYSARDVLSHLRERSGLLVGPGSYSFVHKSVGEFFVAEACFKGTLIDLDGRRLDRTRLFEERYNDRWNTVLFFWTGVASPREVEEFIERVLRGVQERDASLAIGLMLDRLDQLPHKFVNAQLKRALSCKFAKEGLKISFDPRAIPDGRESGFNCTSIRVRAIGPENLWDAIGVFATANLLSWDCVAGANVNIRAGVWVILCERTSSYGDWQKLVQDRDITRKLPAQWPVVGLLTLLRRVECKSEVASGDLLEMFKISFPRLVSVLMFALLGELIDESRHLKPMKHTGSYPELVLSLIHQLALEPLDIDWLVDTRKSYFSGDQDAKIPFDMLNLFATEFQIALRRRMLPENKRNRGIERYVMELLKKRAHVIAERTKTEEAATATALAQATENNTILGIDPSTGVAKDDVSVSASETNLRRMDE